jgi:haloacetate dehalogenase
MPFSNFTRFDVATGDARIAGLRGGNGPALLLLHGHPQTHMIWHRLADRLAAHFTVVLTDLRGYGASSKPRATTHAEAVPHDLYSKRAMAADQVAVMRELGFDKFLVCGHDRGARVAHRMALDYPEQVERLMLLDIAPTLEMYDTADRRFATAYYHWFFLIQPEPLPETLIGGAPDFYIERTLGGRHAGLGIFDPQALAAYKAAFANPDTIHAVCEDYRASAGIDLERDRDDVERGNKVGCPLRVLWGEFGVIEQCFDPLAAWRRVARDVSGRSLACGHYLPEEAPDALYEEMRAFFEAQAS